MLKSWWERLESELKSGDKGGKGMRKFQWLLLLGCVGVGLMIISSFVSVEGDVIPPREPPETEEDTSPAVASAKRDPQTIQDYETQLSAELSAILDKVVGLEQVSVEVNLDSTETTVFEENVVYTKKETKETDREGGERHMTETNEEREVVLVQGKNGSKPIVVKRIKPDVRGIFIVAKGAENLEVKSAVMKAVRAFLEVPPHKIAILPKG